MGITSICKKCVSFTLLYVLMYSIGFGFSAGLPLSVLSGFYSAEPPLVARGEMDNRNIIETRSLETLINRSLRCIFDDNGQIPGPPSG